MQQNQKNLIKLTYTFLVLLSISAYADQCPPATFNVEPQVTSQVTYDQKSKLYQYKYTVKNGSHAILPIEHFVLLTNQAPKLIASPANWNGRFKENEPFRISWMSNTKIGPDGKAVSPGNIRPGQTVSGFSISSTSAPGLVKYFAEGELLDVPVGTAKPGIDEPVPNCPGFDFDGSGGEFAEKILGMVEGPSDPSVTTVKIELKGKAEDLSEKHDSGHHRKIEVLIFGNDNFDVASVDINSVHFGMGQAPVLSSKIISSDVEDKNDGNSNKKQKTEKKHKLLFLTFNPSQVGVRCNLDLALFLTGKAGGKQFVGGVPIKKIKCKKSDLDVGKHRRDEMELGD